MANVSITLRGEIRATTGEPLGGVLVEVAGARTTTDPDGRFSLGGLAPGRVQFLVDGSARPEPYGRFVIGVTLGRTRVEELPYTIWLPPLSAGRTVRVESPLLYDVLATHPDLPGLEIRIPAWTTVRDSRGEPVRELILVPVPLERPPFPMPRGAEFPIYFAVHPADARLEPYGARVIYPNSGGNRPGARITYWQYDPDRGWWPYGKGTVSSDGARVEPDAGVALGRLSGFSIKGFDDGPEPCSVGNGGDPVDLRTGLFVLEEIDLFLDDTIPLALRRMYRRELGFALRPFGRGSTHTYEMFLVPEPELAGMSLFLPDGGRIHFPRVTPGTDAATAEFEHRASPTLYFGARIRRAAPGWLLEMPDSTASFFDGVVPLLQWIRDRNGNRVSIVRDRDEHGKILQVRSPNGRWLAFSYAEHRQVARVEDSAGRVVSYTYDDRNRLTSVTNPLGEVTRYRYDASHRMVAITDGEGFASLENEYDTDGRVVKQRLADGTEYRFAYTLDGAGTVTAAELTDPRGATRRVTFGPSGYPSSEIEAAGTPLARTWSYERDAETNLLRALVDPLGRRVEIEYDARGAPVTIGLAAGTAAAATVRMAYEPGRRLLVSLTDPVGNVSRIERDTAGNAVAVVDARGGTTRLTYDERGRALSVTDATGHVTRFGHEAGDYTRVADPLGREWRLELDAAGRARRMVDPLGRVSRYRHDALDRPERIDDPAGGSVTLTWGHGGVLTSVTDQRGGAVRWSYDARGRMTARTDPLGAPASYRWEAATDLAEFVDRKGQATRFEHDLLGRVTRVAAADGRTLELVYDAADRVVEARDSVSGTVRWTYDALDRVATEETPQGVVRYAYDAAGRRTRMTPDGAPPVEYQWDSAHQLVRVRQGDVDATIEHDDAGRRTAVRFAGGIEYELDHDAASRVTRIAYKAGAILLGEIAYVYDAAGVVRRVSGTSARSALPEPIGVAEYDPANRLVRWGSDAVSHDANGNVTAIGDTRLRWDAQDRLTAVDGTGSVARFDHDAVGRRVRGISGGTTTETLFDGVNPVLHRLDGGETIAWLTGALVDDWRVRLAGGGPAFLLPDAIGSTVALVDGAGTTLVDYTYEPFGRTSSMPPGGNPFQFAGRENVGNDLYDYRNRFYSPRLQRFLSEDPIGLDGGVHAYHYVANNPLSWVDPLGLHCSGVSGANIAGGAASGFGGGLLGATTFQHRPGKGGQAKLGRPTSKWPYWDRSFHFDGPHGKATTPHFNAEFGPFRRLNHRPIPPWAYRLGSTSALRAIGSVALAGGIALGLYDVLTSIPGDRGRALGGFMGGNVGGAIGAIVGGILIPGVGAFLGGMIGGVLGSILGQLLGGLLLPCW